MATIEDLDNAFGALQAELGRQVIGGPDDVLTTWSGLALRAQPIATADWGGLPASGNYNGAIPLLTGAATSLRSATTAAAKRSALARAERALEVMEGLLGI